MQERIVTKRVHVACLVVLMFHSAAFAQGALKGEHLKAVYVKGRWGYADQSGRLVVEARFDAARPFVDGLARVGVVDEELPELEGRPNIKWGYVDESGRVVVELRYTVLRDFSGNLAAAAVLDTEKPKSPAAGRGGSLNLRWGYVERGGRVAVPFRFLAAGDFAEGLAAVDVGGGGGEVSLCGPPANYGYIAETGAFVIEPQFARASQFQNGRARVSVGRITYAGRCLCCNPKLIGRHGSVDRSGKFVADETREGAGEADEGAEVNR